MARARILLDVLQEHGADAAVVSRLSDIRWSTGFTGSNALVVVLENDVHLLTDGRYTTQARQEVDDAVVHIAKATLEASVEELGLLENAVVILYQPDDLTCARFESLEALSPEADWRGVKNLLVRQVAAKSEAEIDAIRRAQAITEATFEHALGLIRPGMTERELAAEIVYDQLRRGAERMSFDPIVAAGPNGALPHARPSSRSFAYGDMIVLDFGCVVDGYASDMTRTVALGEPGKEARHAHSVVLDAQQRAIAAARPGMRGPDLDRVARAIIAEADLGNFFSHGLGHGIGLQTHEWPRVSYSSEDILPENAVVTIEPGVYMPGKFGIRIEDMIVLRSDGAEVLTASTHELICL